MMSCWKRNPKKTHKVSDALRLSTVNIGTLTDQVSNTKVRPVPPPRSSVPVLSTESLAPGEEEKLENVVEWKGVVQRYRLLHNLRMDDDYGDTELGSEPRKTAPARAGSSFYVNRHA